MRHRFVPETEERITRTSAWTNRPATLIRAQHVESSTEFGTCTDSKPYLLAPMRQPQDPGRTSTSPQLIALPMGGRRSGWTSCARCRNGTQRAAARGGRRGSTRPYRYLTWKNAALVADSRCKYYEMITARPRLRLGLRPRDARPCSAGSCQPERHRRRVDAVTARHCGRPVPVSIRKHIRYYRISVLQCQ